MPTDSKLHLRIASPCKAPWENMDGDDRVRFCRECDRNVYDLSAMSEREARRLIAEREGRLCVRFYQRRDGRVLTSDCPVGAKRSFLAAGARSALTVAALASGLTSLAACEPVEDEPVHMGEPLMGSVAIQGDVEGDWDGGVGEHDEPDHPDRVIMGEIAPLGDRE